MRPLLVIFWTVTLAVAVTACGSSSGATDSRALVTQASSSHSPSAHHKDRDNDNDNNNDDSGVLDYGHAADAADRSSVSGLITLYFAAAAAENGATACSLLVPFVAESMVENYGHLPELHGDTCSKVLSKLFKLHHAELAPKQASLKVVGVRVEGNKALVLLYFQSIPEVRLIGVRREGTWRVLGLLDGKLE
jgi:hypothetical protein